MANASPLVSVIIPIYNVESYLAQCLESVLGQSYENLEILLINDGSTDSSGAIARKYASKDPRIHLFTQANAGQSAARNLGLEHAQGEYVSFIDSDDYIDRDFIKELFDHTCETARTTIQTNFLLFGEEFSQIEANFFSKKQLDFTLAPQTIQYLSFYGVSTLFRREIIEKWGIRFPLNRSNAEDSSFLYRYVCFAPDISLIYGSAYHYRQSPTTATGKIRQSRQIPLEPIDTFVEIYRWYKQYNCLLLYGLPFKLLYSFDNYAGNVTDYIHRVQSCVAGLDIPKEIIKQDRQMQQFMQAKDSKDFFLKRYLDSARGFRRYFRLRIKPKDREALFVCFGRVILYYRKEQ